MTQPCSNQLVDKPIILRTPSDGVDVIVYAVDEVIALALSVRDDRLGEFIVPVTAHHAASLARSLHDLLRMTPEQSQALLRDLRAQK
ncbi:MAG: hypothetical protein ACSLE7_16900 [Mycobacterium sp.]